MFAWADPEGGGGRGLGLLGISRFLNRPPFGSNHSEGGPYNPL